MKAIMLMFDSLNRHMLSTYGSDRIKTPNFTRLAKKTVTFDNFYVGSMPCMPARRELQTGRLNFLHRAWGPIEPWDDSMPEILKQNNVYTHMCTDHYHYFEDGGLTYHQRFSSWEFFRGQEGDPWMGEVKDPDDVDFGINRKNYLTRNDKINRRYIVEKEDFPQYKTVSAGLRFMQTNLEEDNWFLQIECFDPHEPFYAPKEFIDMYPDGYDGPFFDWPDYKMVDETPEQVEHLRNQYAALVSFCDYSLGRVLDFMDANDMWKDTMLIVNTDHGFLLSEHEYWAKNIMPWYNELSHIPFFIWDPRLGIQGERRQALAQTIDIPATLLEFFNVDRPKDMEGIPLKETIASDKKIHDAVLFGVHGVAVNVTDGKYVYMRAAATEENAPLFNYTHFATRMEKRYELSNLSDPRTTIAEKPFSFTKGCRPLKILCPSKYELQKGCFLDAHAAGNLLFDLEKDPKQLAPIQDTVIEEKMIREMVRLMKANDAPEEQYIRLGLQDYV